MSDFFIGLLLFLAGWIFIIFIFKFIEKIYGKGCGESIQFWAIFISISILIFLSFFGFFNIYDKIINFVSSKEVVDSMFSNIITITLGVIGIIGIICSIIFGNLYVYYKKNEDERGWTEDKDKVKMTIREGIVWIAFCLYFLFFMLSFFIIPLYNKL